MRRCLVCLLLLGLCLNIFAARAQDGDIIPSDDPPYPCPHTNGAYYQPNLFPRYDIGSKSLVLVDMTTGETVRVLDTLAERNVRLINWSPDCRYLSGAVGEMDYVSVEKSEYIWGQTNSGWTKYQIVLWDAVNGGRIQSFDTPGEHLYVGQYPVIWSPDSNYALALGGCVEVNMRDSCEDEARVRGDFLWNRVTNLQYRLEGEETWKGYESFGYFNQYYWDVARGWLWGSAGTGVVIYSLTDGTLVNNLKNFSGIAGSRFVFSPDDTKVAIYSIANPKTGPGAAITVYDLATMTGTEVNIEGLAAPYIPFADYHPVALSPDNRYLAVGYDAIRVWDLHNLPKNVDDRLPIYRHGGPTARIWSVRFAAPVVIETTSKEGTQRWDLHTGVYIP